MQTAKLNDLASLNLNYDKYESILFGYILSIVKEEARTIDIFSKTLVLLTDKFNNDEYTVENELLEGIRIANRVILEVTNMERQSLLKIFKNSINNLP